MTIVGIILAVLFFDEILTLLKVCSILLIEIVKFAIIYGTLPAMFYLCIYLQTKGN